MRRREARRHLLTLLFEVDVGKQPPSQVLDEFLEKYPAGEETEFVADTFRGILDHLDDIDSLVTSRSPDWLLERMVATDRNILRIAVYELVYAPQIPPAVSINEAVVLAKAFGSEDSGRFVNGVLGAIQRGREHREDVRAAPN